MEILRDGLPNLDYNEEEIVWALIKSKFRKYLGATPQAYNRAPSSPAETKRAKLLLRLRAGRFYRNVSSPVKLASKGLSRVLME